MERPPAQSGGQPATRGARVSVLGGFRFETDEQPSASLSPAAQRLVAYLTTSRDPTARNVTAASLWPEASEHHAAGNLRSALSRLSLPCRRAIAVSSLSLALADDTHVDVWAAKACAHRLLDGQPSVLQGDLRSDTVDLLASDLLPGWYDDWALVAAEEWRQLRLHALESLVTLFITRERYGDAISAALVAVRADPLRESPHRALIRVHMAEGNQTEALEEYRRYRELLRDELGLEPSERLRHLVDDLRGPAGHLAPSAVRP